MTTVEILRAARDLLSVPERWTRGMLARDCNGIDVDASDNDAAQWCLLGALIRVSDNDDSYDARRFLRRVCSPEDTDGLNKWNDAPERTYDDVLAAFSRAIALAEAAEAEQRAALAESESRP